jgi:hypothetical protein
MNLFFSSRLSKFIGLITFCTLSVAALGLPAMADSEYNRRDRSTIAQAQPSSSLSEARRRAEILREHYPGWKDALDPCPCTKREAEANPRFIDATTSFIDTYHPGGKWDYRTSTDAVGTYNSPTLPAGSRTLRPGQQCIYGADGQLITDGPGAGTPDAYSPQITPASFLSGADGQLTPIGPGVGTIYPLAPAQVASLIPTDHMYWDVTTFKSMNLQEYHQTWTPNNSNKCPANFVAMFRIINSTDFLDTGISIKPEDILNIRASGTISFGLRAGEGSPNGISYGSAYNYLVGIRHGRLMARIRQPGMARFRRPPGRGDLDDWFSIGEGGQLAGFSAPGVLEFLVNDSDPRNNTGEFRIEVTIRPSNQ